jgi:hypothetical protein
VVCSEAPVLCMNCHNSLRLISPRELCIAPNAQVASISALWKHEFNSHPRHLAQRKDDLADYFFEDSFLRLAQYAFILLDWAFRAVAVMPFPRPFVLGAGAAV